MKSVECKSNSWVAAFQIDYGIQRKCATILINGVSTRLQIEMASDIILLSSGTYKLLGRPPIKPSRKTFKNASDGVPKLVGELQCDLYLNWINCK